MDEPMRSAFTNSWMPRTGRSLTALLAAAVVAAAVLIVRAINRWHRNKQEAPTPGIGVVPEAT